MKKFINRVDDYLTESLAGFAAAHADLVMVNIDPTYIVRKSLKPGKVAIISGGGSGHELACRPHSPDGCSVRRSGCRANRQIPGIAESAHYARASLWAAIVGSGCAGGVRFAARVVAGMGINAGKKC